MEQNKINGYVLVNSEKFNRAIFGTVGAEGKMTGGVGEGASPEAILAEYDKLGGLILKDGVKMEMGSFYDFENKCPREIAMPAPAAAPMPKAKKAKKAK